MNLNFDSIVSEISCLIVDYWSQMQYYSRNLLDQTGIRLMCRSALDTSVSSHFLAFGGFVSSLIIFVSLALSCFKVLNTKEILERELGIKVNY